MIIKILATGIIGLVSCGAFAAAVTTNDATLDASSGFVTADTNGRERRDDRDDGRDGRQDCRQDEGRVGNDKRDCKQDNRQGDGDEDKS